MIPNLLIGDHFFVAKAAYDLRLRIPFTSLNVPIAKVNDPHRGDIIVFDYPNYEQNPESDGKYYIKRLIGLPGEKIKVSRGVLSINSQIAEQSPLPSEPNPALLPGFSYFKPLELFIERLPGAAVDRVIQRDPYKLLSLEQDLASATNELGGNNCIEVGKRAVTLSLLSAPPSLLNQVCEFEVP